MKESHKFKRRRRGPFWTFLPREQRAKFDKLQGRKIEVKWSDDELIPKDAGL